MAQQRNVTIYWDEIDYSQSSSLNPTTLTKEEKRARTLSQVNLQLERDVLLYKHQWEDRGFANENSLSVTNIQYANLTATEMRRVNKDLVPNDPKYWIHSTTGMGKIYTTVSISPVVRVNGQYQKIRSFSVDYNYKTNRSSNTRIPISNSVLATGNWFKFKVDKTGVYRLTRSFLNDLGMNTDGMFKNGIFPRIDNLQRLAAELGV
ncbi:MAG: hypothetical protein AAF466_13425, partial [Bacteroidota bacterium]